MCSALITVHMSDDEIFVALTTTAAVSISTVLTRHHVAALTDRRRQPSLLRKTLIRLLHFQGALFA